MIWLDTNLLRAYTGRSELYMLLHEETLEDLAEERSPDRNVVLHRRKRTDYISLAVQDCTKAIHLKPSYYYLYITRGKLLLKR